MIWVYKRLRWRSDIEDSSLEECFNQPGSDGWELVTAVNHESGNSPFYADRSVIEYVFKRVNN